MVLCCLHGQFIFAVPLKNWTLQVIVYFRHHVVCLLTFLFFEEVLNYYLRTLASYLNNNFTVPSAVQ